MGLRAARFYYQEQSPIDNILQASFEIQFVGPITRLMPGSV